METSPIWRKVENTRKGELARVVGPALSEGGNAKAVSEVGSKTEV